MQEQNAELAPIGLEADDALGINQTKDTVICSLDKDLLQIPGQHYSWEISGKGWKKPHTFREITEIEGLKLFYEQCLKGDRTDNIRGIEKIGDKKANSILKPYTTELEMFNVVRDMYGNDEEFLMNANCLWILRDENETFTERFAKLQK
jgi:5'-3' exonuclease